MRWLLAVAAVLVPVLTWILSSDSNGDGGLRVIAAIAVAVPLGLWIAIRAPLLMYRLYAIVLGAVPFATVPGSPLPLVLLLGICLAITALVQLPQHRARTPFSALEWATVLLVIVSAVSLVVTVTSGIDLSEFSKWLVATSALFSVARLGWEDLRAVGRSFVWGVAAAAMFALALLLFDPTGSRLSLLSFLGYGATGTDNLRYVVGATGLTARLTGTYVDPNVGGLFLFVGAVLAVAFCRGLPRIMLTALIGVSMVLTLSRSAIFSALVAILVLVVVHHLRFGRRLGVIAVLAGSAGVVMLIPSVQSRLAASFGQYDTGSSDRLDALRDFPKLLAGHWIFGLGWGRPEFRDATAGFATNVVANAPLLSVYRGGLIVGAAFVLVLLVGLILAWRALRSPSFARGVIGAGFVGFALVALQLDFPVVTIAPVTALFSLLLATLSAREPVEAPERSTDPTADAIAEPVVAGELR